MDRLYQNLEDRGDVSNKFLTRLGRLEAIISNVVKSTNKFSGLMVEGEDDVIEISKNFADKMLFYLTDFSECVTLLAEDITEIGELDTELVSILRDTMEEIDD